MMSTSDFVKPGHTFPTRRHVLQDPTVPLGAELDPQARAVLEVMEAAGLPPIQRLSVGEARDRTRAAFVTKGEPIALAAIEELSLPAFDGPLPIRVYRPGPGTLPAALFLHGGGWTLNDLDTHDHLCRRIASRSGWLVASLDYRRAPEHKHPAPLHDAFLAYRWLKDNARRIGSDLGMTAIIGESSGATTAAGLTLMLRETAAPLPSFQVLAYPLLAEFGGLRSHTERASGYALDSEMVRWFLGHYVPDGGEGPSSYLFPLTVRDLSGLPPTLVMTAEFDPLRDDGIIYAQQLAHAGVEVEHLHAEDQMHGFLLMESVIDRAADLVDHLAVALARRSPPAAAT